MQAPFLPGVSWQPNISSLRCTTFPTPATSRFSRDHLSDAELARLLHWWQSTERSAADINGDGMVDASEAALQVGAGEPLWGLSVGTHTQS